MANANNRAAFVQAGLQAVTGLWDKIGPLTKAGGAAVGALWADKLVRGQNSLWSRGIQNFAQGEAAEQQAGNLGGWSEGIANFLKLIKRLLPTMVGDSFDGLIGRLESGYERNPKDTNLNRVGDQPVGDTVALGVAGTSLAVGGTFAGLKALRSKPTDNNTPDNGGSGLSETEAARRNGQGELDLEGKSKTAGIEIEHGRGKLGKLFTVAGIGAAGIGGLAYATSEAKADEPGNTDLAGTNLEQFTKSEINLQGDFGEASFAGEALHKGHVLAHGVQDGLAGLVGSPEDLYDMVDGWTNGWLPGDHNTNSTYNFATEVADDYLISKPEIRSEWDAAVHATGGLASWLIPVGGALKAAGAGAKMVNGARAFETAENIVGTAQIGQAARNFIFQ